MNYVHYINIQVH